MMQEITNKLYHGKPLTDSELVMAHSFYSELCALLDEVRHPFYLATSEARKILNVLTSFKSERCIL